MCFCRSLGCATHTHGSVHASLQEILQLRATLALRTHHAKQAKRDVLAARDELADARRREGSLARELEASRAAGGGQRGAGAVGRAHV